MNKAMLMCLACYFVTDAGARAQSAPADRVWLAPSERTDAQSLWYPQPVTTISGNVISLDNKQLSIQLTGDEVASRFAAHRVIWIEPGRISEKESAALKLFAEHEYSGALRPLIDSLTERPAVWRQQWLSMLAAFAAKQSSRGEIALELVAQLDTRPLAPCVLAWLPVAWENQRLPPASVEVAGRRLGDESPAVRLVAASWLLASPERNKASAELTKLVDDNSRPVLARLAESVLWRTATPPQVNENADDWQRRLDDLPLVLQTGPMLSLAQKFASAGLDQEARQLQLAMKYTPAIPFPTLSKSLSSSSSEQ